METFIGIITVTFSNTTDNASRTKVMAVVDKCSSSSKIRIAETN